MDDYCAKISKGCKEGTAGTAPTGEMWLLIEYPKSWKLRAFTDSDLPLSVKSYLKEGMRSHPGLRILMIKQTNGTNQDINTYVVAPNEKNPYIFGKKIDNYENLLDYNLESFFNESSLKLSFTPIAEPIYLVCTHAEHDKCCGHYGLPLYLLMQQHFGGKVWESSHVGGDRFAPNLICLPHFLYYGHVEVLDVLTIAQNYSQGKIYLKNYRGRACYARPVQFAELYIRQTTDVIDINKLSLFDYKELSLNCWSITFHEEGTKKFHQILVEKDLSSFLLYPSCASSTKVQVNQYKAHSYKLQFN